MSKLKEGQIKTLLFKEAQAKHEHQKQTFVKDFLLEDAEKRVASVLKEAMPQGAGQSSLRNSGWNVEWSHSVPSDRIDQIRQEIEQQFAPYFYQILEGRHRAVMPGFAVSGDRKDNNELVQDGSIYFRFAYHRKLGPQQSDTNQEQQSAYDTSTRAIGALDRVFGGEFSQFKADIESKNVPSQPYFHASDFGANKGGLVKSKKESFFNFIRSERERHKQGIAGARTHNYFSQHEAQLSQTGQLPTSHRREKKRTFSNSNIPRDATFRDLFSAISYKFKDGYSLDTAGLTRMMQGKVNEKMRLYDLDPESTDNKTQGYIKTYKNYFFGLFKDIVVWFRAFEQKGTFPSKADITLEELRMALAHLTVPTGNGKNSLRPDEFAVTTRTSYYSNGLDPSTTRQPLLTLPPVRQLPDGEVRYDRGNGNMGYDHLTSNWSASSGKDPETGEPIITGVGEILKKWGEKCNQWYQILSKGQAKALSAESPEAFDAAQNVFGNRTSAENVLDILAKYPEWESFKQNHLDKSFFSEIRTVYEGAKSIRKEEESGRPSYRANFPIQPDPNTLFNQLDQYGAYMQSLVAANPEAAVHVFDSLNKNLIEHYYNQELDWDTLTLALKRINDYAKRGQIKLDKNDPTLAKNWVGTNVDEIEDADAENETPDETPDETPARPTGEISQMDAQSFKLLKDYGYQTAKMMDFLSAIMTRSSKEEIDQDGVRETVYGHQLSESSGKGRGGEIILSVRYAYNAPELSEDPEIVKKVRDEQRKRHVRARSRLQRQTNFPQQADPTGRFTDPNDPNTEVGTFEQLPNEQAPIVTIVENVEYFLGQAAGKRRFAKTIRHGLPWRQMIDQFMTMYPDIGDQLGVILEPMNADLQRLELSCKRAVDKVRKGIEVHYTGNIGGESVLSSDALQEEAMTLGDDEAAPIVEDTGQDQPSQPPSQPATWNQKYPNVPPIPDAGQPTVPVGQGGAPEETPEEPPGTMDKPMPAVNFVGKSRNEDRRLLRSNSHVSYTLGSIQDRLIHSANKLDEIGEEKMADKIDMLLSRIQEGN